MNKYNPRDCAVFFRTREEYGGLSNMCAGFPIDVCNEKIRTSEALYQAMKFTKKPELQAKIFEQASPMMAKGVTKPWKSYMRPDWFDINKKIMNLVIRIKLVQNWDKFSELLLSTEDRPIVERSYRDTFWGAKPSGDGYMYGQNVLGVQLTKLREEIKQNKCDNKSVLEIPAQVDFLVNNKRLLKVYPPGENTNKKTWVEAFSPQTI